MTVMRPELRLLELIATRQRGWTDGTKVWGSNCPIGRHPGVLTTGGPFFFEPPGEEEPPETLYLERGIVIVNTSDEHTLLVKSKIGAGPYGSAATFFAAGDLKWIAIPPLQDSRFLACRDPSDWYMLAVGGTIEPFYTGS